MKHTALVAVLPLVAAAMLSQSSAGAPPTPVAPSTSIGTTMVETKGIASPSDGDLWPSCWAGNGNLYADFGRGGSAAPDGYVYAYGLDGNWRDSFDDMVADPQSVFLARVTPAISV